jgi:IS30 family transposase
LLCYHRCLCQRRPKTDPLAGALLKSGVGTKAACRMVGITRKTGYRWRAENGGIPPVRLAETARTSRYLSLLERQRIATLRERGCGVREIARRIGRCPSTVSRELRRNLRTHDRGCYDGDLAHARARQRARRLRDARLGRDDALRAVVPASSRRTGVRSRSPTIYAPPTRSSGPGTCATRRSTRRSTTAGKAG